MQRQSMFEGNWELKWSAGVTTALVAFMLISCVGGMWTTATRWAASRR